MGIGKERPILFSPPMVRAILDGKKTMTRRVVKPQPQGHHWNCLGGYKFRHGLYETSKGLAVRFQHSLNGIGEEPLWVSCPYGNVGDFLWVRESFYECIDNNDILRFAADGPPPTTDRRHYKKRPSIFLPKSASRINLEVTDVKVERLNQISNADILSEGIRSESCNVCVHTGGSGCESCFSVLKPFRELWDGINGKTSGKSWDDNPFVWVVSFRRISA